MSEEIRNYKIGPFTKENFEIQKWKHIKEKIFQLNSTNEEETIPDCREMLNLLLEMNSYPNINEYFGEQNIKNFFCNEFLILNAKNLIATKTFNNPEILELSNRCLEEMVFFWLRMIYEDNPKLTEMAKTILDPARSYFRLNNQEDVPKSVVPSFLKPPTEEHLKWISTLKQGDEVDCIKIEGIYKKMCWSRAKIVDILDSHLKISFLFDKETTSRFLDKTANAHEIAPVNSRCKDFDWRLSLKQGDELDACDTSHVWYNATVLNVRETVTEDGKPIKEIYIGYRIYNENGDKVDTEGRRFIGWSARYDEWLTVTNPRIAKKNSMAKKLYMGSSSNNDDPVVDDSNDKIYNADGSVIYAVTRPAHSKSIFMINLINKIGEMGGFERMLQRIADTDNWAPIEITSLIVTILGNIHAVLHRDFCYDYVPRLKEAVWRNLLKSPDSNIRNFTKERIDNIIQAFDGLLKRVYSLPEKYEMIENLSLEICSICFESNFLERKLQGLKSLLEIIKNLRFGSLKYITVDYLNKFILSHSIFDKIYGSKGHVQLMQRSADFLKYMINENILSTEELEIVWNATTKGDMETKLSIYKVLSEISLHFKNEHLDFLIKKISNIPPSDIIPDEIELVYELSRFCLKGSEFTKKARDFFWNIISDEKGEFSQQITELTLNKFCDIMKNWELKDERIDVLYGCVNNIKSEVSVLASIKILKKLIEHYPSISATSEGFTKATCVEHLCKEKDMLTILINDLKLFKSNIKKRLGNAREVTEATLDSLVGERANYLSHVSERLQFISYVLSNCETGDISLSYDLLSEIWDVIVNDAYIPAERDVVFKWIKESAESKSGFPMPIDDLLRFYKEKMNNQQDTRNATLEGFNCFKNVFLIINEKLQKIVKVNARTGGETSYGGHMIGGTYYGSYSYEEKTSAGEFEYKVNVMPAELEGINSIWNFILAAESENVVEKAIDFLNKLYNHVGNDLESRIIEIREEFLATCFKNFKEILNNRKSLSESAFTSGCIRCLSLIRSLMDETEKKGVGNLKSHSGLVKGELLTFNVTNDITSGSDVPKKVELRMHSNTTVYELRVEVGRHFKVTWDQVKLSRGLTSKEIKDNDNGKTIGDIRIRNGESLTASKRPTPPIPQVPLIMPDGTLNPLARKVFVEWFETYSENGKMSPEHCAAFIHSCTNDHCKADDKRVKEVFATYDTDRDGFLTLENFLDFYTSASKSRGHVVWNNLHAHHYRNDLKKATEVEEEKVDITTLARYIISTNKEYFHIIFSLLDFGGKIAIEAWKLLNSLPTSSEIFADIVSLKGIREAEQKNWDHILDSSSTYKMLYALHVIEYLMEDEGEIEDESKETHHLWSNNPKLAEYKKNWRADFIVYGGFDHLFKIFNIFARKDHSTFSIFDKNILSFILKILKNYLTATFASTVPNLYRYLSFIRLFHLSLDFINDYLKADHQKEESTAIEIEKPAETDKESSQGSKSVKFDDDALAAAGADDETLLSKLTKLVKKDSKVEKADEKKKEKQKIEETAEFKNLVESLRGELGQHIIKTINLKDLISLVSSLGYDILNMNGDLETEERMILEYSVTILTAILLYDKSTIPYFLNIDQGNGLKGSDKYILDGIFCPKSLNVRRYFSHAFYVLCKDTMNWESSLPAKFFIQLFLKNLPSANDESKKDCNQYFELLCKLIEETFSGTSDSQDSLNFEELITLTIDQLKNHVSQEKRNNLHINDKIFIGLLQLCEKILNVRPHLREIVGAKDRHNLVEEIFCTCLFDVQERETSFQDLYDDQDTNVFDKNYVKAKSRDSRSAAYKLLITLCKDSTANTEILLRCLSQLMGVIQKLNTATGWGYSPASDTKSFYGYVGLKNLGCICYMNAMLQQFFMTPAFRYGVLLADDKKEPNWVKKDNKYIIDDNVIHQLQQMFGFLELSDRQDYNPHEFCFSFKDFAGQPVNVSIQQDTQEFLNMIFEKLENGLKHTPFKNITDSVYGGRTSNQLICEGCGFVRERIENFYNMSVEVRNMKTIYDSFDKFITGETIEDYYCDECKKKNNITKRTCIESLPNVLIIHLQRIVFDLDTLMNQKINSRLEFPFELNLEPYTKEGLEWREKAKDKKKKKPQQTEQKGDKGDEDVIQPEVSEETAMQEEVSAEEESGPYKLHPKEYYEYKLAGVVVHVGTAEFGHYYSYINTNRGDPNKRDKSKPDKWLEFNDSLIKDFDTKNIENECFGGSSTESSDDAWSWAKSGKENSKNAYILVYERAIKEPIKLVAQTPEDEADLHRVLRLDRNPEIVKKVPQEIGEGPDKKIVQNYLVDYYSIKRFVPARIYKKVWEDNHKFMFERHIYNDDFFRFFKEVCNSLKLPPLPPNHVGQINPEHVNLSPETKKNIGGMINALSILIFNLLARAHDNNSIGDLAIQLKNLLALAPEYNWNFFENTVLKDLKPTLDLMLTCPDKQVRYYCTQIILYSINVMISYYGFKLDVAKMREKESTVEQMSDEEKQLYHIEESILKFLQLLITIMPTEVAKNWMKFQQYFEFWRDFACAGEAQIGYLFQKQFIAVLIDFFLEKKSPVPELSEKKYSMGNRYAEPEFNPLIQTIALLVRRGRVNTPSGNVPYTSMYHQGFTLYDFNENDLKCLYCADFYEKAIKEKYDPQALGIIIPHFSFENEAFSCNIAQILLRGLNKSNYDDCKPYLEALTYFLNIVDFLQLKRIEWTLGYPQPNLTTIRDGPDSFGIYGNSSLEDIVVNYESPLYIDGSTSLINLMLQNRKRFENLCLVCLKQLLILADVNVAVFEYIITLPPPSYNYAKFTDWILPFIEYYLAEAKRYYYSSYPKEEQGQETLKIYRAVEEKINKRIEFNQKALKASLQQTSKESGVTVSTEASEEEPQNKQTQVLPGLFQPYIIGQTVNEKEIGRQTFTQESDPYSISLVQSEIECYIAESKPTGTGNLSFPDSILHESKIISSEVKPDTPLAFFVQPRNFNVIPSDQQQAAVQSRGMNASGDTTDPAMRLSKMLEEAAIYGGSPGSDHDDIAPLLDDNDNHERMVGFIGPQLPRDGSDTEIDSKGSHHEDAGDQPSRNIVQAVMDKVAENQREGQWRKEEEIEEVKPDETKAMVEEKKEEIVGEQKDTVIEIEEKEPPALTVPFEVNPVLRRFIIFNDSPFHLGVILTITPKPNSFANFRIPNCPFRLIVKPKTKFAVVTLMKLSASAPWGEYDVHCNIEKLGGASGGKQDDSGRKKNATFQIRPIDLTNGRGDIVSDAMRASGNYTGDSLL